MKTVHKFKPVFDKNSKILILGTMPSPKSLENGFYYSHPQNRFWKTLASLFNEPLPSGPQEKTSFLLAHNIALWDVLKECNINGAQDYSIKNPKPNDMRLVLKNCKIKAVFTTGQKAFALYQKYCFPETGLEAFPLPSTSPANCRLAFEELVLAYAQILKHLC